MADTLVRSYEAPGIWMGEVHYDAGFTLAAHSHEAAHVTMLLRGAVDEQCDRKRRIAEPGMVSLLPTGVVHATGFPMPVAAFHVTLAGEAMDRVNCKPGMLLRPADFHEPQLMQIMQRLHVEVRAQDSYTPLAIEGLVLELIAGIGRAESIDHDAAPRWLRQAKDLLHDRYEQPISLDEIAALFGVHPSHLSRAFRKHYGVTVGDYLRYLRLEASRHDLSATDLPLGEIALKAGFCDQSHFTKAFKRAQGLTPAEYRRMSRPRI